MNSRKNPFQKIRYGIKRPWTNAASRKYVLEHARLIYIYGFRNWANADIKAVELFVSR